MPFVLDLFVAIVFAGCLTSIFLGVYLDHTRHQRKKRSLSTLTTCVESHLQRGKALEVIGGSYRDEAPS